MLFSWLPFFILGISSSLLVAGVDRSLKDKGGKEVEGALKSQLTTKYNVPDMSWSNAEKLLKEPPTTDHIVLFYVPLHVGCRQFLNIFTTLAQQFQQEERHVTFVKVDCSRASFRENICHRYNISAVPTVAYVSTLEFQRELLPSRNMLQCSLRWSIANMMEDIGAVHATCYKGDLFFYQELLDWATLLYNISQLNRRMDAIWQSSFFKGIRSLLSP